MKLAREMRLANEAKEIVRLAKFEARTRPARSSPCKENRRQCPDHVPSDLTMWLRLSIIPAAFQSRRESRRLCWNSRFVSKSFGRIHTAQLLSMLSILSLFSIFRCRQICASRPGHVAGLAAMRSAAGKVRRQQHKRCAGLKQATLERIFFRTGRCPVDDKRGTRGRFNT